MSAAMVPVWAQWVVALLLMFGSVLALIGCIGLLRLTNFFQRIHAPTLGNTLGTWSTVAASMLFFSMLQARPVLHELLIGCFIVLTAPVTSVLLVRAAIFRDRRASLFKVDTPVGYTDETAVDRAKRRP